MTGSAARCRRRDLVAEAIAGVLQRPGRSLATMAGTVLGIGSLVVILGLATTAAGQVSDRFSLLEATQVIITDVGVGRTPAASSSFPGDAARRVMELNGAEVAGRWWTLPFETPVVSGGPPGATATAQAFDVQAVTPSLLAAAQVDVVDGVAFDRFHDDRAQRVAVVGAVVARQMQLPAVERQPAIFVDGVPFTVIGVIGSAGRLPALGLSVLIPASTAAQAFGPPGAGPPESMLVRTTVGAAPLVARQAALALRPDQPQLLKAVPPPRVEALEQDIRGTIDTLFVGLAVASVLAGAISIANTTMVATLERVGEIGLRRALGARPWHIAAQFLGEAGALGAIGGLIGTALGAATVVVVAIVRDWTAVLEPLFVVPMPLLGALVGLLAGALPARRAARTEPAHALRR